jgi:transcriptional regulator with XRE-family HTH domain
MSEIAPDDVPALGEMQRGIGPRIALMRRRAALTLEKLAERTGFTKGYLSRIENARVIPPIATLAQIAHALELNVAELLAAPSNDTHRRIAFRRRHEQSVVHGGDAFGYDYSALASGTQGMRMTSFLMTFSEAVGQDVRFHHEGEEFVYLLEGRLTFEIRVDGRAHFYVLEPGDSLHFDSRLPHQARSLRGTSRALVVVAELPAGPASPDGSGG